MTVLLYDRLGGYEAIATFANNLIGAAQAGGLLARFWLHRSEGRNARVMQLLIDYLVRETGGQMYYTGRDIAPAHAGMAISEADWHRFVDVAGSVVRELQIQTPEPTEVKAFLEALKLEIVAAEQHAHTKTVGEKS